MTDRPTDAVTTSLTWFGESVTYGASSTGYKLELSGVPTNTCVCFVLDSGRFYPRGQLSGYGEEYCAYVVVGGGLGGFGVVVNSVGHWDRNMNEHCIIME